EPKIGDWHANLQMCENMIHEAARQKAEWIILPEFFTTGMAFEPKIVEAIQSPNGKAFNLLLELAKKHRAYVGGSFIVRDDDNIHRHAFFLAETYGTLGRPEKDLRTTPVKCL